MLPSVDIITGGFPCQDISVAGNGAGLEGKRSGLFFEIVRLIDECKPRWVFLENVPAIRTRGAEQVIGSLACRGYDCRWITLRASDVGAPHERNRWWMLAHHTDRISNTDSVPLWQQSGRISRTGKPAAATNPASDGQEKQMANTASYGRGERRTQSELRHGVNDATSSSSEMANADSKRLEIRESWQSGQREAAFGKDWWATERGLDRVAYGIPHRVDRLRGLGNAVVPAQARKAFQILAGLE
jgi:DNA (cytosine-5)-methyltransferase 1